MRALVRCRIMPAHPLDRAMRAGVAGHLSPQYCVRAPHDGLSLAAHLIDRRQLPLLAWEAVRRAAWRGRGLPALRLVSACISPPVAGRTAEREDHLCEGDRSGVGAAVVDLVGGAAAASRA
jgi:hypothetical protein